MRIILFCMAVLWATNCSGVLWACGAPEEIRTPDPQIRSLVSCAAEAETDQSRIRLSRSVPSWPHLAGCDQGLDGINGDNDPAAPVVTRHGRQARVRKLSSPDQIANVIGTAPDNGGCLFDAERQALGKMDARLFCGGAHRRALPA